MSTRVGIFEVSVATHAALRMFIMQVLVSQLNFLVNRNAEWTDCIVDKILKKVEIGKFITTALKSILKLVKLQSLVAKRCKMWKM